jgi:triphosphoribosyl-dephospho-CoA synthase
VLRVRSILAGARAARSPSLQGCSLSLQQQIQLACLLEVSAPKPGNVGPLREFADTSFADMARSALVLGEALAEERARRLPVGQLIADAIEATARVAQANTNLGIVLLFAPLARAAATRRAGEELRAATSRTLAALDVADAEAAFAAIVRARPGGLGDGGEHDVRRPARGSLREAMAAAAQRDSIASEYASDYAIVFGEGLPLLRSALERGLPTLEAIVALALELLARRPDTLIARKAGPQAAEAVSRAAAEVVAGRRSRAELDAQLREDHNRLNPGATADLVAATLLAAQLCGIALP